MGRSMEWQVTKKTSMGSFKGNLIGSLNENLLEKAGGELYNFCPPIGCPYFRG